MTQATPAPWAWLQPPAPHHRAYRAGHFWRDRTIADRARDLAMADPDMVVFPGLDPAPTFASLLTDGEALCAAILDLGIRPGEVISFQTPNWIEAAVINLAAAIGGFVINPIVTIYRDAEVRQMLADCGAKLFFICERFRNYDFAAMVDRIRPDLPELDHVVFVRSSRPGNYDELLASGRGRIPDVPRVDPDAVKMLLYTSGTTGRPKGVLHSHNTLARVMEVCAEHWGWQPGDRMLVPSPVTHVSGYSNGLELPFLAGSHTVLMESWNAETAVELIDRFQVVATVAATPFLAELAHAAHKAGSQLKSLRVFACGGAAVPPPTIRAGNAAFANVCAFRVFGSSEVPLVTLGWPGAENQERAATSDGEIRDYDVLIVDEEDRVLPDGEDGEILARGPAMFMGYADQAQTAASITAEGYFRTGDIGHRLPDGGLRITDRKKDLIIRGGENISAKEIEDVLITHDGVAEVAVVAMPHERLGEGVCAFLVASGDASVDDAALIATVNASGLAKQKIPERFAWIDEMPRTPSGKIRKDVLRRLAREAAEATLSNA